MSLRTEEQVHTGGRIVERCETAGSDLTVWSTQRLQGLKSAPINRLGPESVLIGHHSVSLTYV